MTVSPTVEQTRLILARQVKEADFQRDVVAFAKARRWHVQHSRTALSKSGRYSTPIQGHAGFVDLVLVRDGVLLFVELKKVGAYLSPDQRIWHARLKAAAADIRIWRPTDWPEIEEVLT
jgi:hypothetical protein